MSNQTNKLSISSKASADEKARDFFNRMVEEQKEPDEAISERIVQLFDEFFEVSTNNKKNIDCLKQVFAIGYELGWNDYYNLFDNAETQEGGQQ